MFSRGLVGRNGVFPALFPISCSVVKSRESVDDDSDGRGKANCTEPLLLPLLSVSLDELSVLDADTSCGVYDGRFSVCSVVAAGSAFSCRTKGSYRLVALTTSCPQQHWLHTLTRPRSDRSSITATSGLHT
jgi:hypothetical protein